MFNFQTRMAKGMFKTCEFVETIFSTMQLIELRTIGDWHIRWEEDSVIDSLPYWKPDLGR